MIYNQWYAILPSTVVTVDKILARIVIPQKPKAPSFRSGEKLLSGDSPIVMYRKIREHLKNKQGIQ